MNQFVTNTYFSGCNLGRIGKIVALPRHGKLHDRTNRARSLELIEIGNPTGFGINKELLCASDIGPKKSWPICDTRQSPIQI
jgi:hypothetical protein